MSEYIEEAYVALIASLKAELAAARARIEELRPLRQGLAQGLQGQGLNRVSALAQGNQ